MKKIVWLLTSQRSVNGTQAVPQENIAGVSDNGYEELNTLIRGCAQQLALSYDTTQSILRSNLHLNAYSTMVRPLETSICLIVLIQASYKSQLLNWNLEHTADNADFRKKEQIEW